LEIFLTQEAPWIGARKFLPAFSAQLRHVRFETILDFGNEWNILSTQSEGIVHAGRLWIVESENRCCYTENHGANSNDVYLFAHEPTSPLGDMLLTDQIYAAILERSRVKSCL
jgi:hypothetical protein